MNLSGSTVKSPNRHLQFLIIVFFAVMAFGAILYWREESMIAAEYVEFPTKLKGKSVNAGFLSSPRYQIEVEETSPTVY